MLYIQLLKIAHEKYVETNSLFFISTVSSLNNTKTYKNWEKNA